MADRRAASQQRTKQQGEPSLKDSPEESQASAEARGPLYREKLQLLCAAASFAVSFVLYVLTLAPTVTFVDSGEMIVAARTLGVAHPPGFPLYTLLAHLASAAPIGSVAARVNFASALFAALASAAMALLVAEALLVASQQRARRRGAEKKARPKKNPRKTPQAARRADDFAAENQPWIVMAIPVLVSSLLLACSRTLWSYATIAEVYTLNTLLIILIFFLMARWRRKIIEGQSQKPARAQSDGPLYLAAFLFGLALGVHHVTVALTLPAVALLVYSTSGSSFFVSKRLGYAALFAFAGLTIYAYLPLAAWRSPVMNWGNPATLERLWWHVTGRQFQTFFSVDAGVMIEQLKEFARFTAREYGPWWLPAALALVAAGFAFAFKRDRTLFWFLVLVIVFDLAYALNYDIAEDKDAYYLPAFISLAMAAGFGARWLVELIMTRLVRASAPRVAASFALLLVPAVALAANLPYNDRSRYFVAHDYVTNIQSAIEPGGMLLTLDWQVYSPMLYTREVENLRRDIVAIDQNLLRRSWYFDYLDRAYPELMRQTRDKVEAFLEDLRAWEQDPEIYDRNLALNQRINTRFYDMIFAFITNHLQRAPVYVTKEIAVGAGKDEDLTRWLGKNYQLVPQGLLFQAVSGNQFHEPASPQFSMRGINDGTLKFEPDDVVRLKVLPVYRDMLTNRGRYLAAFGQHARAIEMFEQALRLDPDFALAKQALGESNKALGEAGTVKRE
jgi:tetratricopeptide (TPR) repeat protein